MLNLPQLLAERKLLMVGGKGGVGKTTTAAALAVAAAKMNRRVLLISTDPAHSLADAFDQTIGGKVTKMAANLDALELDPNEEVEAYLDRVLRQMRRYAGPDQVNELRRQLRLSSQSPGAQEAAVLERMANLIEESDADYDLVIFDTAPTGHTLRLLSLPEIMAAWTDGLLKHNHRSEKLGKTLAHLTPNRSLDTPFEDPTKNATEGLDKRSQELTETLLARQSLFQRTRRRLNDSKNTAFIFVLTPEKLPILETTRAINSLKEAKIPVAGAVINRIMPDPGQDPFWAARFERQQEQLKEIAEKLAGVETLAMPLMASDIQGMDQLASFAEQLNQ